MTLLLTFALVFVGSFAGVFAAFHGCCLFCGPHWPRIVKKSRREVGGSACLLRNRFVRFNSYAGAEQNASTG